MAAYLIMYYENRCILGPMMFLDFTYNYKSFLISCLGDVRQSQRTQRFPLQYIESRTIQVLALRHQL